MPQSLPTTDTAAVWPGGHKDFLSEIFHAAEPGETGCIATVHVANGRETFPAYAWPEYSAQDFHTHYGVGLHLPRDPGEPRKNRFRRTKKTWTGMALMVLDDVGEDKGGGAILIPDLAPSFVVETKPGSQQWGYVFDQPVRDYGEARVLLNASKWANVNDPHGQNPARLVRLPGSQPPGKKHAAELVEWTGTRFSVEEVVEGLDLDLEAAQEWSAQRGQGEYQINLNGMNYANMRLFPEAQEQLQDILINLLIEPDAYHWNMNRLAIALANWFGFGMPKIDAFLRAVVELAHATGRIDHALYDKHITKVQTMAAHYAALGQKNRAEVRKIILEESAEDRFMRIAENLPDLDLAIDYLQNLKKERGQ